MTALKLAATQQWRQMPAWLRSSTVHTAVAMVTALGLLMWFGAVVQSVVSQGEVFRAQFAAPVKATRPADMSARTSPGVDGV